MTGYLVTLILIFGCLIELPGLISGQTVCQYKFPWNALCDPVGVLALSQHCCRWIYDGEDGDRKSKRCCSATAKCGNVPGDPDDYDEPTCKLPACYELTPQDTCSVQVYKEKYKQLPMGAAAVDKCCEKNGEIVGKRECCILLHEGPFCLHYFPHTGNECDIPP